MKKIPTKQQFKDRAIAEATAIRDNATEYEKSKLDFDEFNPDHACSCIYGLMTGDCRSERSVTLLNKCAMPFFKVVDRAVTGNTKFERSLAIPASEVPLSYLETYILHVDRDHNEKVVNFIKGIEDELMPEDLKDLNFWL